MRRPGRSIGFYIAGIGILIILAIILPPELWWLFIGLALVLIGILILRC